VRCSSNSGVRRSRAISNPESDEAKKPTPKQKSDEALGDRTESTQSEAAGVFGVLNLGRDVLDDVIDLLVTEVAGESRHVGRAGANCLDDLEGRNIAQRRRERAVASASPSPSMV
jgi:hypothetical protein